MEKPRTSVTLTFNESEIVCIKAALFRYAKEPTLGKFAKLRAERLAEVIKEASLAFYSETYLESDLLGHHSSPAKRAYDETEDESQYGAIIKQLIATW